MPLYHFSEQADITRFVPHRAPTSTLDDKLVWAIDEWHAPMYLVPRDCPRACFWPRPETSDEDRERWFGGIDAKMVIAIESGWLERVRNTTLYRYEMSEGSFERRLDGSGHWVSRETVVPLRVEPMGDLLNALTAAQVELRITPSLLAMWKRVIASTLAFSGTRLRNAVGFVENFER